MPAKPKRKPKPPTRHNPDEVLAFIKAYQMANPGVSPTGRVIMAGCDIPSSSNVWTILHELEVRGELRLMDKGRTGMVLKGARLTFDEPP